jgi:hypothetical protein
MTSQGTAHGRFTRAIKCGRANAEMAARQLGSLSLADALSLVLLYQLAGDEKFEGCAPVDHGLLGASRELRLPAPTLSP